MNIFDFRNQLVSEYAQYVRSFIRIGNRDIEAKVDQFLNQGAFWPEPLIQLNPSFEFGATIDQLVAEKVLHPECAKIFRKDKAAGFSGHAMQLHLHQEQAVRESRSGQNYVLTTGTGSGKSLAYIVPIVDHVLRHGTRKGIQAIIVYPMNALANSQEGELRKFLEFDFPEGKSGHLEKSVLGSG